MKYPNFNEEKKIRKLGWEFVAGVDEAGRGPLAGPVVACALAFGKLEIKHLGIRDSKKLNARQREAIYIALRKNPAVLWGVGVVSEKVIDRINILEATKLAMKKAVFELRGKIGESAPLFVFLDGNFTIGIGEGVVEKPVVRADEKIMSCSAASIIAKVSRDRLMLKYHKRFPQYGFDCHKGYGTDFHYRMLKKHGPSPIHRFSFNLGLAA